MSKFVYLCLIVLLLSACQATTVNPVSSVPDTGKTLSQAATAPTSTTAPTAGLPLTASSTPAMNTPAASPASDTPTTTPMINTPTPISPSATLAAGEVIVDQAAKILGIWKGNYGIDGGPGFINFHSNGSFTVAPSPDGAHGLSGTYEFQNQDFQIHDDFCQSDVGHYQVRLQTTSGSVVSLRFILVDDPCGERVYRLLNHGETWAKQP